MERTGLKVNKDKREKGERVRLTLDDQAVKLRMWWTIAVLRTESRGVRTVARKYHDR